MIGSCVFQGKKMFVSECLFTIDAGGVAEVLLQGGAAVAGVFQDGPGSSL